MSELILTLLREISAYAELNFERFTQEVLQLALPVKEIPAEDISLQILQLKNRCCEIDDAIQALYDTYTRWCQDNAEKPMVTATFSQYLKDNAEELNIQRNKNIPNNEGKRVRGYEGIRVISEHDFRRLPDGYKTPFD